PAPPDLSPLSLHDALPIFVELPAVRIDLQAPLRRGDYLVGPVWVRLRQGLGQMTGKARVPPPRPGRAQHLEGILAVGKAPHRGRSEEHTSELQSLAYLVCR